MPIGPVFYYEDHDLITYIMHRCKVPRYEALTILSTMYVWNIQALRDYLNKKHIPMGYMWKWNGKGYRCE
jgi:hypothetical protein